MHIPYKASYMRDCYNAAHWKQTSEGMESSHGNGKWHQYFKALPKPLCQDHVRSTKSIFPGQPFYRKSTCKTQKLIHSAKKKKINKIK